MQYTPRGREGRGSNSQDSDEALFDSLEPVIRGMKMALIELSVFRGKKTGKSRASSVQVRAVVLSGIPGGVTGLDDCSRVHRGILPRLELAFPEQDIYLEVSSPGIDRAIKDGSEFVHYIGRGVKCYRTDISDWTAGILCAADENGVVLRLEKGKAALPQGLEEKIPFEVIAKARLGELQ